MKLPECFQPEAIQVMRDWFGRTNRKVIALGPFLPTGAQATANELLQSPMAAEIMSFLDQVVTSHGKKSLLYVRACLHVCVVSGFIVLS